MFVDTATLYPIWLADLVLRLAEVGMFELLWSDHPLPRLSESSWSQGGLPPDRARYSLNSYDDIPTTCSR
ncbi:MAG: hypothetical protein ACRD0K_08745 [Egibacteraceae bacterium]